MPNDIDVGACSSGASGYAPRARFEQGGSRTPIAGGPDASLREPHMLIAGDPLLVRLSKSRSTTVAV